MKFLHSMIRVNDLEKSMKFYTELLGLVPVESVRLEDCTLHYLKDEESGFVLELTDNDEKPEGGYPVGEVFGHFAFEVDDMLVAYRKVEKFGGDWIYEPFYLPEIKTQIAFLRDPDGNEIELVEKISSL